MVNIEQSKVLIQSKVGVLHEVTVSHDQSMWRMLAEKASLEQDPEKLMGLVEELNGTRSARESFATRRVRPAGAA